jgi:hypothetical protein
MNENCNVKISLSLVYKYVNIMGIHRFMHQTGKGQVRVFPFILLAHINSSFYERDAFLAKLFFSITSRTIIIHIYINIYMVTWGNADFVHI